MNDFTKEELERILEGVAWWLDGDSALYSEKLIHKIQSMIDNYKCLHESDGLIYTSNPPQNKCEICGEFYR
jgi:hypothetical protein